MQKPDTTQKLQDIFDKLIEETKGKCLATKESGAQYMNYEDFRNLCETIKSTYCAIMEVEETPACISEACNKTLNHILQYRAPLSIGGVVAPPPLTTLVNEVRKLVKRSEDISAEAEQILKESLHAAFSQLRHTTEKNNISSN